MKTSMLTTQSKATGIQGHRPENQLQPRRQKVKPDIWHRWPFPIQPC